MKLSVNDMSNFGCPLTLSITFQNIFWPGQTGLQGNISVYGLCDDDTLIPLYLSLVYMNIQSLSLMYKTRGNNVCEGCDCLRSQGVFEYIHFHYCIIYYIKGIAKHFGEILFTFLQRVE